MGTSVHERKRQKERDRDVEERGFS